MKKVVSIITLSILLTSCSTLKKTVVYSSLSGAMAGASAGYLLSPDKPSRGVNAAIFGLVGAGVAALAGYSLYEEDPRNKKLNHLLDPQDAIDSGSLELDLDNLRIDANLSKEETYKTPVKELPPQLKGKIKKQYVIKYQSKERYLNKGNKTFYIPPFQIYEHSYESLEGDKNE